MKVVQINLNHCETAHDLLLQMVREKKVDVVIVSEPYKKLHNNVWITDISQKAAIWTCGSLPFEETNTQFNGFVRAKIKGIYFYSCYAPPSWTQYEFQKMLDELAADAQTKTLVVIAGDFNAWATSWGSRSSNARGQSLLETFALLDIVLMNDGKRNTFRKAGTGSIIDITFVSTSLTRITKWWVCEDFTNSDHQAIIFEIKKPKLKKQIRKLTGPKWKDTAFDEQTMREMVKSYQLKPGSAEELTKQVKDMLVVACDASMPRRIVSRRGSPCYWWNENIASLRAKCLKARRIVQRSRGRSEFNAKLLEFKDLRNTLKNAIKLSKKKCFESLREEIDTNPWGTAYRIVMKKMNCHKSPQITCPIKLKNIIETLFPHHSVTSIVGLRRTIVGGDESLTITQEELYAACKRIGDNKTPGPDGIPNKALKFAIRERPDIFIQVFQKCLAEGVFPNQWKLQNLVLIPKGSKSPEGATSYRPICLLNSMGKILERIIYDRLLQHAEQREALSEHQYGFRKSRSTIDAVNMVKKIATNAIAGTRWKEGSKQYCAVVTLDVKNAFNSANWNYIKRALFKIEAPVYILDIITSYFTNRKLMYYSESGTEFYSITAGVPQGSVLGPLLWNLMYDEVLRLPLPSEVNIIGFADDIAIVTVAKHIHEVEDKTNFAIAKVKTWLESASLDLAEHKTEAILISSRKKVEYMSIKVGNQVIKSSHSLKYLGVVLDNRLNFKEHINYASSKAAGVQTALARLMPNIGGPKPAMRRLLASVINSVILYASPVWAEALAVKEVRRKLTSIHRLSALRTISGFRTVSAEAACVVAGMLPIDVLVDELQRIYDRSMMNPTARKKVRKEERANSIVKWQSRWNSASKGRWTHTLIPNITSWLERKHGETTYYMTQFLTGHGCFRKYLHRFGHDSSPLCPDCMDQDEDANHAIFHCPRFRILNQNPQHIVGYMLQNEEHWEETTLSVTNILIELRRVERERAQNVNIIETA